MVLQDFGYLLVVR